MKTTAVLLVLLLAAGCSGSSGTSPTLLPPRPSTTSPGGSIPSEEVAHISGAIDSTNESLTLLASDLGSGNRGQAKRDATTLSARASELTDLLVSDSSLFTGATAESVYSSVYAWSDGAAVLSGEILVAGIDTSGYPGFAQRATSFTSQTATLQQQLKDLSA